MNTRVTILWLVAGLLLVGCASERVMIPRMEPMLPDVPVPTAFKFDPTHSTDFVSTETGQRLNNYSYTGKAVRIDVVDFYQRQMPLDGWKLQQNVGAGGQQRLFFKKTIVPEGLTEAPNCIVTVMGKGENATGIQILRMER